MEYISGKIQDVCSLTAEIIHPGDTLRYNPHKANTYGDLRVELAESSEEGEYNPIFLRRLKIERTSKAQAEAEERDKARRDSFNSERRRYDGYMAQRQRFTGSDFVTYQYPDSKSSRASGLLLKPGGLVEVIRVQAEPLSDRPIPPTIICRYIGGLECANLNEMPLTDVATVDGISLEDFLKKQAFMFNASEGVTRVLDITNLSGLGIVTRKLRMLWF